ncbi:MAG: succinate dehydrogenase assembly factor 2 [Kangiellaceae bacterium]|nr:succinate dehydrogenase assembly factor 2 [Kangiellaceae bacterium]
MTAQQTKKRLEWQCRRGMLELDVILIPFLNEYFLSLTELEQQTFEELLTYPDPDLYTWIMGFGDCEFDSLVEMIQKVRLKMNIR